MEARDLVDENVGAFQALDDKIVYILSKQGALWREHGSNQEPRTLVEEKNVGAFQTVVARAIYCIEWMRKGKGLFNNYYRRLKNSKPHTIGPPE
jgi:hypothetical protein